MKGKVLLLFVLVIISGFVTAKVAFKIYYSPTEEKYNSYFVQSGVYTDKETLEKSLKKLNGYVTEEKDNKYYVYVGISTDEENAEKIKEIYKKNNIDVYIKKSNINNMEFFSNLEQYDILLKEVDKIDDINSINKVILSSYQEIVLGKA